MSRLGVRWTIGDVSGDGFRALRLSIAAARRAFGPQTELAVCVNTVPVEEARERVGKLPCEVSWRAAEREDVPEFLRRRLDGGMAEGVGWKFAPLRIFPALHELSLDNDCIVWEAPRAVREWLADPRPTFVAAADVRTCFGQFVSWCGPEPLNSGIRGLPPAFDLGRALEQLLEEHPVTLRSELDEQGMQMAVLRRSGPVRVVGVDEVSICSPFPPHLPGLGRCGAHFVGLNARELPWKLDGRPASELTSAHFARHLPAVRERAGLWDAPQWTEGGAAPG
jgi:hypothetical protein